MNSENKVADALSRIEINNEEEEDDSLSMLPQASDLPLSPTKS